MSLWYLIVLFIVYSFFGWVSEVIYCFFLTGRWINRGFLHGPLCPIYGFGGLLVIFALQPFRANVALVFIAAIVITTVLEYLTSWVLEKLFSTRWWDYSNYSFNFEGRVCLRNSLLFGVMSVVAVEFIHPAVSGLLNQVPALLITTAGALFLVLGMTDLTLTIHSLVGYRSLLSSMREFLEHVAGLTELPAWFNEQDLRGSLASLRLKIANGDTAAPDGAADTTAEREKDDPLSLRLVERLETLIRRSRRIGRLLRAFPGVRSRQHDRQLAILKTLQQTVRRVRTERRKAKRS